MPFSFTWGKYDSSLGIRSICRIIARIIHCFLSNNPNQHRASLWTHTQVDHIASSLFSFVLPSKITDQFSFSLGLLSNLQKGSGHLPVITKSNTCSRIWRTSEGFSFRWTKVTESTFVSKSPVQA